MDTHLRNDDSEYKDYDIYIDNVDGKDWMGSFFFEYARKQYTALVIQCAERPDGEFKDAKSYPASVSRQMNDERNRIIRNKGNI